MKTWTHSKRMGGGQFGCSAPMACLKIHMEFSPSDIREIWGAIHRFATLIPHIYSSNHPKNLCYVVIIKNNYGPTLSSSWLKSLQTARGKLSPQKNGGGYSVKVKSNGSISEPKYQSLSSGWGTYSFPPFIVPVSCLHPLKKATLKNSHFKWEWFCWHRVEQYSMAVKYNKGITVLFWFILMYKGRKRTNFKGFASGPDFRP